MADQQRAPFKNQPRPTTTRKAEVAWPILMTILAIAAVVIAVFGGRSVVAAVIWPVATTILSWALYARRPRSYATLSGDATERAVVDLAMLLKHGYVERYGSTPSGRMLRLTPLGWRTYWHHHLVIRRLPDDQHDKTCPCATEGHHDAR